MKRVRICIIGHFGGKKKYNDGQTVKVKSLHAGLGNALKKAAKIRTIDTYYFRKNPFLIFCSLVRTIFTDKFIIFLPATNGRKVLFKLMYFFRVVLKKKVFHDCIGGSLVKELPNNPKWKKYLNSFNGNWMESQIQTDALISLGIQNVKYIPNFKNIEPLSRKDMTQTFHLPLKFCTFSRVLPEKGIEDAAEAVSFVNSYYGTKKAILHIYGPVQDGYDEWFRLLLNKYSGEIIYCGNVEPNNSVATLKSYFALLFPTHYFTEGMPGTIIDSFFSGLPVISRKWAYCDQMIKNNYNGISYDFDKPDLLKQILIQCVENPKTIISFKTNCLEEAQKYTEKNVVSKILKEMDLCEK